MDNTANGTGEVKLTSLDRLSWRIYDFVGRLYAQGPIAHDSDNTSGEAKSEGLRAMIDAQSNLESRIGSQAVNDTVRILMLPGGGFGCIDERLREVKEWGNHPLLVASVCYFYVSIIEVAKLMVYTYVLERMLVH